MASNSVMMQVKPWYDISTQYQAPTENCGTAPTFSLSYFLPSSNDHCCCVSLQLRDLFAILLAAATLWLAQRTIDKGMTLL